MLLYFVRREIGYVMYRLIIVLCFISFKIKSVLFGKSRGFREFDIYKLNIL